MTKRYFTLFAVLFTLFLLGPASAEAGIIRFHVTNSSGVPQPGATVFNTTTGSPIFAEADGWTPKLNFKVGTTVLVRRIDFWGEGAACPTAEMASPEGEGIAYTVRADSPETVEIVLPALSNPNYVSTTPGQLSNERAFVGLLNEYRAAENLQPLEISDTLSDSTDRYASYLAVDAVKHEYPHCMFYSMATRFIDSGYIGTSSEVLSGWVSPRNAIDWLMSSPPHRKSIMDPDASVIGIGYASSATGNAGQYVAWTGQCHDTRVCGTNGDYGDASLADQTGDDVDSRVLPGLRLQSARIKRKGRITLFYRIDPTADPADITARATKRGRSKALHSKRDDGWIIVRGRISKGRWRVAVRYSGSDSWAPQLRQSCFRVKAKHHRLRLKRCG